MIYDYKIIDSFMTNVENIYNLKLLLEEITSVAPQLNI